MINKGDILQLVRTSFEVKEKGLEFMGEYEVRCTCRRKVQVVKDDGGRACAMKDLFQKVGD